MMCPLRLITKYSSPLVVNVMTLAPFILVDLDLPSERMVDILLAAFAFSVITSFFIVLVISFNL